VPISLVFPMQRHIRHWKKKCGSLVAFFFWQSSFFFQIPAEIGKLEKAPKFGNQQLFKDVQAFFLSHPDLDVVCHLATAKIGRQFGSRFSLLGKSWSISSLRSQFEAQLAQSGIIEFEACQVHRSEAAVIFKKSFSFKTIRNWNRVEGGLFGTFWWEMLCDWVFPNEEILQ